ncbi:hypothetical protein ALQ40_102002 [Pseudomonas syringae]|nr:hypothetical protein ALQ40_102002 [Pseudomonas syringae]
MRPPFYRTSRGGILMKNTQRQNQQLLADYYRKNLGDPAGMAGQSKSLHEMRARAESYEDSWNIQEENLLGDFRPPRTKDEFLQWYLSCEKKINDDIAFFVDFLKNESTLEQVAFYICMEEMVDGSFDDLMAVTQLGMPIQCKMVAGNNYWDEMGNGNFSLVHSTMFRQSSDYMRVVLSNAGVSIDVPPTECLMNGNILLMWASRREYNVRLIGAMGLVEGSAPTRFGATTFAMERLGLPKDVIAYHKAHIMIDTYHSEAWYETVLNHYSSCGEEIIKELSIGVMVRYNVAVRYYTYMYNKLRSIGL